MKTDRRIFVVSLVIFLCIGCDQTTKSIAGRALAIDKPVRLLGDIVHLAYSENHGAMLGLGAELPAEARFWLFIVFAGCALLGILAFTVVSGRLTPLNVISLSLVLGGGLSNLIDRLLRGGVIIDFVVITVGPIKTAIFNVADLTIFVGLVILVLSNLSLPSKSSQESV
jgi:signal peptidase II